VTDTWLGQDLNHLERLFGCLVRGSNSPSPNCITHKATLASSPPFLRLYRQSVHWKGKSSMAQQFASSARRALRQSPAAFLRQCRAEARKALGAHFVASAVPQKTCYSATGAHNAHHLGRSSLPHSPSVFRPDGQVRSFSSSAASCGTTVLQNPRIDEDGNEMTIEISDRAAKVCDSRMPHYFLSRVLVLAEARSLTRIANAAP
jgi:hypothetical protein